MTEFKFKFDSIFAPPAPLTEWTQDPEILSSVDLDPRDNTDRPIGCLRSVGSVGRSVADPTVVEAWVREHVTPTMIEGTLGTVLDRVDEDLSSNGEGWEPHDWECFFLDSQDIESLFWVLKLVLPEDSVCLARWILRWEEIDQEASNLFYATEI